MNDTRNLVDHYKGKAIEEIVADLDSDSIGLEIAIENLERDFNMGTIVRSANAFGVRHIHVVGRRQWNKRGAMMTDKYLHMHYYADVDDFLAAVGSRTLIAIDNVEGAASLHDVSLPLDSILVFGAEGPGISDELRNRCQTTVAIEQHGSTRSINVGVAAGIAMYVWTQQHVLGRRAN